MNHACKVHKTTHPEDKDCNFELSCPAPDSEIAAQLSFSQSFKTAYTKPSSQN